MKLSKYDRGADTKTLLRNRTAATEPLEDNFTAPTHMMLLKDAAEEGVQDEKLQDIIVNSAQRIKKVHI